MLYIKFNRKPLKGNPPLCKKKRTPWGKIVNRIRVMLLSNPDFEDKIQYVAQWYLEYDEEGHGSWREIGLDINKKVIVKMPDERNYGFWLDTNCTIEDLKKEFGIQMITEQDFNTLWNSVYYDREAQKFKPIQDEG
jgi:hypothetical protein